MAEDREEVRQAVFDDLMATEQALLIYRVGDAMRVRFMFDGDQEQFVEFVGRALATATISAEKLLEEWPQP